MDYSSAYPYRQLYLEHHSWLEGWLRQKLGCVYDAADLTQDTYVRIITSGRLPRPEQSRPFLIQVAKGLAIDLRRRRGLEWLVIVWSRPLKKFPPIRSTF